MRATKKTVLLKYENILTNFWTRYTSQAHNNAYLLSEIKRVMQSCISWAGVRWLKSWHIELSDLLDALVNKDLVVVSLCGDLAEVAWQFIRQLHLLLRAEVGCPAQLAEGVLAAPTEIRHRTSHDHKGDQLQPQFPESRSTKNSVTWNKQFLLNYYLSVTWL